MSPLSDAEADRLWRRVDAIGEDGAETARAQESHEKVCAERYLAISGQLAMLQKQMRMLYFGLVSIAIAAGFLQGKAAELIMQIIAKF